MRHSIVLTRHCIYTNKPLQSVYFMAKQHTLSVYWVRLIFQLLEKQGLNSKQMFTAAGLKLDRMVDPSAQFSQDGLTRLWQLASQASNNPAIGLGLGDMPVLMAFDAYSVSQVSSRSVGEAMQRGVRFQHIVGGALNLSVERTSNACKVSFASCGETMPAATQGFDAGLALSLSTMRLSTHENIIPLWVEFAYPQPVDTKPYEAFFQCPLKFNAKQYCLALAPEVLELPMSFANAQLAQYHDQALERSLKSATNAPLSQQVDEFIRQYLPSGEPSLALVAEALHISVRSIQRHLHSEHSSFRQLLDNRRKQLALQYLQQDLALQEITFLLGFADHGNFYRAFRRWYGQPPGRYKQTLDGQ